MKQEWENKAETLLNSQQAQQLLKQKDAIGQIASSGDGQKVKAMMEGNSAVSDALAAGDMNALRSALTGILKTEEGARLAAQLGNLMQKPK